MDKAAFQKIKEQAGQFQYTSMCYTDYEEVEQYEQRIHNEKLILLYGYNKERGYQEYHWACSNKEELLTAIGTDNKDVLVSFVPAEWVEAFLKFDFGFMPFTTAILIRIFVISRMLGHRSC
jgi:hypothetical protein